MEFLKSSELTLNPANYLISSASNKPVNHPSFVSQQRAADYIVRLAEAVKDKNFTHGKIDDLAAIKSKVKAEMDAASTNNYVEMPNEPKSKVQDELTQHALDFVKYLDQKENAENINKIMQQYNSINDVETVGDYFQEGLVKLNKIYSINEILSAVKIYIEKVG